MERLMLAREWGWTFGWEDEHNQGEDIRGQGQCLLTHATAMIPKAKRLGPSRFQSPWRSICRAMESSMAPSRYSTCGAAGHPSGWVPSSPPRATGPHTSLLDHWLEPGHGDDSDPDRHEGAQEVTELQHVVLHDAEHHDAGLVTSMVKLV